MLLHIERALALCLQCAFCSPHRSRTGSGENTSCLITPRASQHAEALEAVVQPSVIRVALNPLITERVR